MSWARLDDRFHGNPKVLRVWNTQPAAVGLYVMGITYCAQHETDGRVHEWFIASLTPLKRARNTLVKALVDARLWVPAEDGWDLPDYLDFNPSHADLDAKRERERERGRRARTRQPDDTLPATPRQPAEVLPSPVPSPNNSTVAASGDPAQVWETYSATRHAVLGPRSTPRFTADRRALITRRLRDWPLDDLLDAVQGWRHFPHNRGENDRNQPFCDIELVLRDTAHIERFRDKHREHAGTAAGESMAELADRMTAAHEAAA